MVRQLLDMGRVRANYRLTVIIGPADAGAGSFEVSAAHHLRTVTKKTVEGRAKLGVEAFAEALLGFPKVRSLLDGAL